MKTGVDLIAQERNRQIEEEKWDSDHDDSHTSMCLTTASASYALDVAARHGKVHESWSKTFKDCSDKIWPFDDEWFKPTPDDPVRQLVKAGALIAAEIHRLQRIDS